MQKYIKNDFSEIRYFKDDVKVSDWIDLKEYRLMTNIEILKHETNPNTDYHVWNGSAWVDNRTAEEIAEYDRSLLQPLTKRQFALYLYDLGLYDQVMDALNADMRFKIELETVATVERNSPTVAAMGQLLGWDDATIDKKWEEALTL